MCYEVLNIGIFIITGKHLVRLLKNKKKSGMNEWRVLTNITTLNTIPLCTMKSRYFLHYVTLQYGAL